MVDFKKVTDSVKEAVEGVVDKAEGMVGEVKEKAEGLVEGRGGIAGLKEDLAEVKDIVTGEGSIGDKARAAVDALKDPGPADQPAPEA